MAPGRGIREPGYTWVSSYPWGWTPYRYGSWTYLSSYGWFWQPGSTWAGWNTVPRIVNAPQRFNTPRPPCHAGTDFAGQPWPRCWARALSRVDRKYAAARQASGVARGSVRNLGRVSQQVGSARPRSGRPSARGTMHASSARPRHVTRLWCAARAPSTCRQHGRPADEQWVRYLPPRLRAGIPTSSGKREFTGT